MDDKKQSLSIYLLKPAAVAAFEQTFAGADTGSVTLAEPLEGLFVPLVSEPREPSWVPGVRALLGVESLALPDSQSPAGFLMVRRGTATFVLSFGHAWARLDDEWLERDFGRKVVLNSIDAESLLEIRAEQVFAKGHIANERSPHAARVNEFGVEFDRDLVNAIGGRSAVKELGEVVRGAKSLRVQIPFPSELTQVLDKALLLSKSKAYTKDWPEIDNISPVSDTALIAQLEAQLDADFAAGVAEKSLMLFTPAYRRDDGGSVESYVFGRMSKKSIARPYLMIGSWLDFLKQANKTPSVAEAKETPVHVIYEAPDPPKTYTAFDCFAYELTLNGAPYILSSSTWYEVTSKFVKATNDALKMIGAPAIALPGWNQVDSEGAYNALCGKQPGFLNCDAKTLHYGGAKSQLEFCDVLHLRKKSLFFAKIVSKSAGMSHLVEQVRTTTALFFAADDSYRKELQKLFKTHHPAADRAWLDARPKNGDWDLSLVSLGKPKEKLPFFAKCSLVKLNRYLGERGHRMSFVKV